MLLLETIKVGLSQMTKDHKHIAIFYCVNSIVIKTWVDNLLPKVNVVERNQLMHCVTKSTFNAIWEEVMQESLDKHGACEYIEGEWDGLTYVWRNLWPKVGIFFNYGHVDTTNLVERHWQFIKYTTLRRRVNLSNAYCNRELCPCHLHWRDRDRMYM